MSTAPDPTYAAFAALLDYPDDALVDVLDSIEAHLRERMRVPQAVRAGLDRFFAYVRERDLLTLQENYVALFDRGRATSLHLFEHVHGESRERGTAMVDLKQVYARAGLQLRGGELPDYLPALLEFMSLRPREEGREMLQDCAHILCSVGDALHARDSRYAAIFAALLSLAGEPGLTRAKPIEPGPADEDLDKEWTDEPVIFGPAAACGEAKAQVAPIHFHPRGQ